MILFALSSDEILIFRNLKDQLLDWSQVMTAQCALDVRLMIPGIFLIPSIKLDAASNR